MSLESRSICYEYCNELMIAIIDCLWSPLSQCTLRTKFKIL